LEITLEDLADVPELPRIAESPPVMSRPVQVPQYSYTAPTSPVEPPPPPEKTTGVKCPYCLYPVAGSEPVVHCSHCGQPHHTECWRENTRCTTYGCAGRPLNGMPPQTLLSPLAVEVDAHGRGVYQCDKCGAEMPDTAGRCPQCGKPSARKVGKYHASDGEVSIWTRGLLYALALIPCYGQIIGMVSAAVYLTSPQSARKSFGGWLLAYSIVVMVVYLVLGNFFDFW